MSSNNLTATGALCGTCQKSLPKTGNYIKCLKCNNNYHYSPCSTLAESTYSSMTAERKSAWKCHQCRGDRPKSPLNAYHAFIYKDVQTQQHHPLEVLNEKHQQQDEIEDQQQDIQLEQQQASKKQRDEESPKNENAKKFKDSSSLNVTNIVSNSSQNDIIEIKQSIAAMNCSVIDSQNKMREEMSNSFEKLTSMMTVLVTQVNNLTEQNENQNKRIVAIEEKNIVLENKNIILEQELVKRGVEINSLRNTDITPIDAIKKIAASVEVCVQDSDIDNSYKIKRNNKIIVEFCSLNKKKELMSKIHSHRVEGNILNTNNPPDNSLDHSKRDVVFVNDQLTQHYRHLMWLAKKKSKEVGWKFVWFSNGHLYAKKDEQSSPIQLITENDVNLIA